MKAWKKCDILMLNCKVSEIFFYNERNLSLEFRAISLCRNLLLEAVRSESDRK